jgi:hypothetical protein
MKLFKRLKYLLFKKKFIKLGARFVDNKYIPDILMEHNVILYVYDDFVPEQGTLNATAIIIKKDLEV